MTHNPTLSDRSDEQQTLADADDDQEAVDE